MNKPLMAAGVFTMCALGFLVYSWVSYASTKAAADDGLAAWQSTADARTKLDQLKQELAVVEPPPAPKVVNVSNTFGKIAEAVGIDISQLKVEGGRGSSAKEQSHNTVRLNSVKFAVIGNLLEVIRTQYPYLQVLTIEMRGILQKPGEFNLTLEISVPAGK